MKRIITSVLCAALMSGILATASYAADGVEIDKTNFPDDNFRSFVAAELDGDDDGMLSADEIASATNIRADGKGIKSLQGIEYFTAVTYLTCTDNELTAIDVSKNTALTDFFCYDNQLTSVDVSKNTLLKRFGCEMNDLTSVDISKNTALTYFNCSFNALTSVDVSKNTSLVNLYVHSNKLTSIDVSKNTALEELEISYTSITELDLSNNTELTLLEGTNAGITSLDLSANTKLDRVIFDDCKYAVTGLKSNSVDLTALPGDFDVSKASEWSGGTVSGNILTANDSVKDITYKYDCGNGKSVILSIHLGGYTVYFDSIDGTGEMKPLTDISGLLELPECTILPPLGKQFKCWHISNGDEITDNLFLISRDMRFYATWEDSDHVHKNPTFHKGVEVTCIKDGSHDYYLCSCGHKFFDAECKEHVETDKDLIIRSPMGHLDNDRNHICDNCEKFLGVTPPAPVTDASATEVPTTDAPMADTSSADGETEPEDSETEPVGSEAADTSDAQTTYVVDTAANIGNTTSEPTSSEPSDTADGTVYIAGNESKGAFPWLAVMLAVVVIAAGATVGVILYRRKVYYSYHDEDDDYYEDDEE